MIQATAQEDAVRSATNWDNAVIAELFRGEQAALARFVARKLDRRVIARIDAIDVVQDVFLLAIRKINRQFEGGSLPCAGWLRTIAADRLKQVYRRHVRARKRSVCCEIHNNQLELYESQTDHRISVDAWENNPLDRQDLRERIARLMAELPKTDQDILRQRVIDRRPIDEVAKILGITSCAVRKRQARALQRLRGRLMDEPPGEREC